MSTENADHSEPARSLPGREGSDRPPSGLDRRALLQYMGASAALASGVAGCARKPVRKILSRAEAPEYARPGEPLHYASTWTEGSQAYGILVRCLDGRPLAIEGDPEHPINRGSACAAMKASILSLYDPDRLRTPLRAERPIDWAEVDAEVTGALRRAKRVALMTRAHLGPSERALVAAFLEACPGSRHMVHEALGDGPRRTAWAQIFGGAGELLPRIDRTAVLLCLEGDLLGSDGAVLEATRWFAERRNPTLGREMLRLYAVEGPLTLTGMNADHRIPLRPSVIPALAKALRLFLEGAPGPLQELARTQTLDHGLLTALARDLAGHRGRALVWAGPHLPAAAQAEVCLLNQALEAYGRTLMWAPEPAMLPLTPPAEVEAFCAEGVDVLLLLGLNPVYDWPAGGFETLLAQADLSVGHDLLRTETLAACRLALPSSHYLESWNDRAGRPGLACLCQPVLSPLFGSRQEAESLFTWTKALAEEQPTLAACRDWHDFLQTRWLSGVAAGEKAAAWDQALRRGGRFQVEELAPPPPRVEAARALADRAQAAQQGLELVVLPHHSLHDGRFAANAWLQELPDPVSRIVWDTGLCLGPAEARARGLTEGDMVEVRAGAGRASFPVLIQPGTAPGVAAVSLGGGRTRAGRVGSGRGFAAAGLLQPRSSLSPFLYAGAELVGLGRRHAFARTQKHFSMEGRPIALAGTAAEFEADPAFVKKRIHLPKMVQAHDSFDYSKGSKWGMAVDLTRCTGCGACVTACQAENNIPVVGKTEIALGRQMHWMRIDLYADGDEANPTWQRQPMLCQHCDNAPCETVCPVYATTHSPEGLNEMTYNRCVGTRYCANNCPYKVRRFNFFNYQKRNLNDPVQELAFNPGVTVRAVGVMEKCSFCLQRITEARFRQKDRGMERPPDGSIKTACQQACPAGAIVFGDLNDPASRVAELKADPRAYFVLEELNVKPNVAYLARVANPSPDVGGGLR